jgi:hypothetical protein
MGHDESIHVYGKAGRLRQMIGNCANGGVICLVFITPTKNSPKLRQTSSGG